MGISNSVKGTQWKTNLFLSKQFWFVDGDQEFKFEPLCNTWEQFDV